MYSKALIGPALGRLRRASKITQKEVAESVGVTSTAAVSRLEQPESNPQGRVLLGYLDAIGKTLTDLDRELRQPLDPLDAEIQKADERLETDPGFRDLARSMLSELEYEPRPDGPVAGMLEKLGAFSEHDRRLEEHEQRIRELEQHIQPKS